MLRAALDAVRQRGYDIRAAVFLGGREKLAGALDLGVPIIDAQGDWPSTRQKLADAIEPGDVVVDASDSPVVEERDRWRLAALSLSMGARYEGPGFRFDAPYRPQMSKAPSIAVVANSKRAGKTAIASHLARLAAARGRRPVVVAMGRGGPAAPTVVRGDLEPPTIEALCAVSAAGGHAASDFYEDAVLAGVATVGARRAGAGPGGHALHDTVGHAIAEAEKLDPGVIILEGSGSAIPPAAAASTVTVLRMGDDPDTLGSLVRILLADLVVVTMQEEQPHGFPDLLSSLKFLAGDVAVVGVVFRPTPVQPVHGETIFYATTAPESMSGILVSHLEREHGARVVGISHALSDRVRLVADLEAARGSYGVLLTELKAAAIDTAARVAIADGARVVFADNRPFGASDDLDQALGALLP